MKEKLNQLLETIAKAEADVENRKLFQAVVSQCLASGMFALSELADEFSCSCPTIQRWSDGESACHPVGRPSVYRLIKEKVKAKM